MYQFNNLLNNIFNVPERAPKIKLLLTRYVHANDIITPLNIFSFKRYVT